MIYLQPSPPLHTPLHTTALRFYARRTQHTPRTTTVETEQQNAATNLQQSANTTNAWQQTQTEPIADKEETTEQSLTPDIRRHLSKVYGTLVSGLGVATAATLVGLLVPGLAFVGMVGSLVAVIGLLFTDPSKQIRRRNLFYSVCGLMGMGIAPLLAVSSAGVIFAAALGTSAIFGGFSIAAMKARRKSMLMLGGVLGGGLLLVVVCSLAGLVLPLLGVTNPAILGALYNINLYLGLGVFSLFIAYDTQRMIEDYRAGNTDHISPALNLFLNVINIFVRLLQIFGGNK